MIISLLDRQGTDKSLSGVSGTSVQSVYTKPNMEPTRALANISWLPFPYGPLPDVGPGSNKTDTENWENERDENAVTEEPTPGATGKQSNAGLMTSDAFKLVVIVFCAWIIVKFIPKG